MYLEGNTHGLVNSFKWGFLSDNVVDALSRVSEGKEISEEQQESLKEGVSFIQTILSGREQVKTERYEANALESIKIYSKSLDILLEMPDLPRQVDMEEIENLFKNLRNTLCKILDGEHLDEMDVKKTLFFFHGLQKITLDDSSSILDEFNDSRSLGEWELSPGI